MMTRQHISFFVLSWLLGNLLFGSTNTPKIEAEAVFVRRMPTYVQKEEKRPTEEISGQGVEDSGTVTTTTVAKYIKEQAMLMGTNVNLALDLAYWESRYDTSARNASSTAKGVFQYLDGTWKTYCSGNQFDHNDNVDCAVRMLYDQELLKHWSADENICGKLIENGYLEDKTEC